MPEIYRSAPLNALGQSGVLVIHCSDPRYQPHFQDFVRKGLGLERYALIAVPGGAHFLTLEEYLPKFSWVGWRWVKFMVDLNPPSRLILIAHDDCRWYLDSRFGHDPARLRERQVADSQRVRAGLAGRFGVPRVELYRARLENGRALFETV